MDAAIRTQGLRKTFGRSVALDGLDVSVERGEIFGFLGPNGAGKSTTIRLLLDLIRPSAGSASILGHDCQHDALEARSVAGYLSGDVRLWGALTGTETVDLVAGVRGNEAAPAYARALAERLGLGLDHRAGVLSKGNRQKLGVVLALMSRPPVLILDEPTSGLDPIAQHEVWAILRDEASRGTTVFFSSHVMSEVEQVCERVAILRQGKLVAVQPVAELRAHRARRIEVSFKASAPPPGTLDVPGIRETRRSEATIEFEATGDVDALVKALARFHVTDIRSEQPSLDEIVLSLYAGRPDNAPDSV